MRTDAALAFRLASHALAVKCKFGDAHGKEKVRV